MQTIYFVFMSKVHKSYMPRHVIDVVRFKGVSTIFMFYISDGVRKKKYYKYIFIFFWIRLGGFAMINRSFSCLQSYPLVDKMYFRQNITFACTLFVSDSFRICVLLESMPTFLTTIIETDRFRSVRVVDGNTPTPATIHRQALLCFHMHTRVWL